MSEILKHFTFEFKAGRDLEIAEVEAFFDSVISCTDESVLIELLSAWNSKGSSDDELFEIAKLMRRRMKTISSEQTNVVDIVGTGGSGTKSFNVSTAAAFVIAGAGIPIAKHGNRAATNNSGSADVLTTLGINIDVTPEVTENCLNELGICFMYAPLFHKLSPALAKARRELRQPTIFNNLGPLCNPAGAQHRIIGVWSDTLVHKTARVLERLGSGRSWVVFGREGIDEIALYGQTEVADLSSEGITTRTIDSAEIGANPRNEDLPRRLSALESARIVHDILSNNRCGEDAEQLVLINAAAAIYVAGKSLDIREAYLCAEESIRSGTAIKKLTALINATN